MSEKEKELNSQDQKICATESKDIPAENGDAVQPEKPSRKKKILNIVIWTAIAIMAILLIALWQIDRIAATATRTVGSTLTGTKVDVQSISISPLTGAVKVNSFTVGNPEGFHNPTAIKVGKFHVDMDMSSIFADKVIIEHLELSDVAIDFEYTFSKGSNLDVILKNLENATGANKKAEKAEEKSAAEKQVVIRKLILKNAKVTVSSGTLKTTMVIPLIPIEMENVGEGSDLAGTIREVLVKIIAEITKVVNFDAIGKGIVSGTESAVDAVGDFLKKIPGLKK